MNIKKSCIIILIALSAVLCACGKGGEQVTDPYEGTAPLASAAFDVSPEVIDASLAVGDTFVYLLYPHRITTLDLRTGEESAYCTDMGGSLICANGKRVYTFDGNEETVRIFENGSLIKEIKCALDGEAPKGIYAKGKHFLLVANDMSKKTPESNIYYADLESGECRLIEGESFKSGKATVIDSIGFQDENTLLLVAAVNITVTGYDYELIRYDIAKEKLIERLQFASQLTHPVYNEYDKCFYGVLNINGIAKYSPEEDQIYRLGSRYGVSDGEKVNTTRFMTAGTSVIAFDGGAEHKIVVTNFAPENTITVYMPDTRINLERIEQLYREKFGGNIHFVLHSDVGEEKKDSSLYYDKIRTKLMAKDKDPDVFFIYNHSYEGEPYLLGSLLKNSAYEPLEAYEGISSGFDNMISGAENTVTYKGHIFGVPITTVTPAGCYAVYDRSALRHDGVNLSSSDILEICEGLTEDGDAALFDYFDLSVFLVSFAQNAVESGKADQKELEELLTGFRNYYNKGVLEAVGSEKKPLLTTILFDEVYSHFFYNLGEYPEGGTVMLSSDEGIVYHSPQQLAMVNPNSDNKDAAVDFLTVLLSEECIYDTSVYYGTRLGKDLTGYDNYSSLRESDIEYLTALGTSFEKSEPVIFNIYYFLEYLNENDFSDKLFSGEMTPTDVAEDICSFIEYTYFE